MSATSHDPRQDLALLWAADKDSIAQLDAVCGASTPCRNMKEVDFDRWGDSPGRRAEAWREQLAREGKLKNTTGS